MKSDVIFDIREPKFKVAQAYDELEKFNRLKMHECTAFLLSKSILYTAHDSRLDFLSS